MSDDQEAIVSGTWQVTGVRTVAVPVTDQDKALIFYTGTLGFSVRVDAPLPQVGGRWIEVAPEGSATTVALIPAGDDRPAGVDTGIRFASGDAAGAHEALTAKGVTVSELMRWPGVPPMFTVSDPDGNGFVIVGDQS